MRDAPSPWTVRSAQRRAIGGHRRRECLDAARPPATADVPRLVAARRGRDSDSGFAQGLGLHAPPTIPIGQNRRPSGHIRREACPTLDPRPTRQPFQTWPVPPTATARDAKGFPCSDRPQIPTTAPNRTPRRSAAASGLRQPHRRVPRVLGRPAADAPSSRPPPRRDPHRRMGYASAGADPTLLVREPGRVVAAIQGSGSTRHRHCRCPPYALT